MRKAPVIMQRAEFLAQEVSGVIKGKEDDEGVYGGPVVKKTIYINVNLYIGLKT